MSINMITSIYAYYTDLCSYKEFIKSIVLKEFKGRFKYTALGYFWHILNPLVLILIYMAVFSLIFGRDIPHYWAYLSTGMFAYSFFSSSLSETAFLFFKKKKEYQEFVRPLFT